MLNKQVTFTVGLTTRRGTSLQPDSVITGASQTLAELGLDGFTVTEHTGYWKGEPERSLSFIVIYDSAGFVGFDPAGIASRLATTFDQDAVLYAIHGVFAELIGQRGDVA